MTFGFSRDDAGKFLSYYYDNKVYESDPFATIDAGVAKLVEMGVALGQRATPISSAASAASTAATRRASTRSTASVWTT